MNAQLDFVSKVVHIDIKKRPGCIICNDTGCHTCTQYKDIKLLTRELHALQELQNYIEQVSNPAIYLKPQQIAETHDFKRMVTPLMVDYKEDLIYWQFITITFDPNKFGIHNTVKDEKNYILWALRKLKEHYSVCYGVFEYFKTGTVHAHAIVRMESSPGLFKKELKKYFTNNPRNRVAIQMDPAKYPNAINYINKIGIKEQDRGDEWFFYNPTESDLDYIAPTYAPNTN